MAHLSGFRIQLKSDLGVFKEYVKLMEDKAVYRVEMSVAPNEPVYPVFETLRRDVKIDSDSPSL
jgi:hypothetical protein